MNYSIQIQSNTLLMEELRQQRSNRTKRISHFALVFAFLTSLLGFSGVANAAIDKELIKSTFTSQPTDPYSFIKQQLRYQGFRQAITNELKKMNLNADLFWSKYEEKFNETFLPTEEKLKQTHGIGGEAKVSVVKKVAFERELRRAKLTRLARFGNLAKVVSRFSVKKISRSTKNANRRFMRMNVQVNRRALQKVYMQFVTSKSTVQYDRLIVHPRLSLNNGAWTDLGVSTKTVLEGALYDSWQNWFVTNFSDVANLIEFERSNGPAVEVVRTSKVSSSSESHSSDTTSEDGVTNESAKVETSNASDLRQIHLFLEASVRKTFEDDLENYRGFAFKIYANIIDGQTGELIASHDLNTEPQSFSTVNIKELSSNVASAIYNLPLKDLERLKSEVFKYKSSISKIQISVDHFPADLIALKARIEEIGLGMGVQAQVVKYLPKASTLSINYAGEDERLTQFIANLNELEFVKSKGASVEYDPTTSQILIGKNMPKKAMVAPGSEESQMEPQMEDQTQSPADKPVEN